MHTCWVRLFNCRGMLTTAGFGKRFRSKPTMESRRTAFIGTTSLSEFACSPAWPQGSILAAILATILKGGGRDTNGFGPETRLSGSSPSLARLGPAPAGRSLASDPVLELFAQIQPSRASGSSWDQTRTRTWRSQSWGTQTRACRFEFGLGPGPGLFAQITFPVSGAMSAPLHAICHMLAYGIR